MSQSIFTKIIQGEIPCHKIYEDDHVIAFLDVHPLTEGHTLVVPKTEIDHIWDLPDDEYDYLMSVVKKLGTHMQQIVSVPRIGVVVEGFGVPHAHVHLVPLQTTEDLKKRQDLNGEPNHAHLSDVAEKLRYDGN